MKNLFISLNSYSAINGSELQKLCAKRVGYQDKVNSNHFPTILFEYKLKGIQIFMKFVKKTNGK
jgi:hypothetical protein